MSSKHLDRPIQTSADDILGRKDFAEQTAMLFKNWKGHDSLVVALYGEWGSGKTSVKNLILDQLSVPKLQQEVSSLIQKLISYIDKKYQYDFKFHFKNSEIKLLKKQKKILDTHYYVFKCDNYVCQIYEEITQKLEMIEKSPIIVEFNPWEWASQDVIVEAFFNQLIKKLGKKDKTLGKLLAKYKNALNGVNAIISILSSNTTTIFSAFMIIGGTLGISTQILNNYLAIILNALGGGLLMAEKVLTTINPWFKSEIKNAEEIKKEIGSILLKRDAPTIIILDDLDRLTAEQIKTIMQLVKVNADFPNTIFFMLYQKDIVEKKLTNNKQDGSLYMEKIVQLVLDIPVTTSNAISDYLFKSLPSIYYESITENSDFVRLWHDSLKVCFINLRDVKRFLFIQEVYSVYFQDDKQLFNIDILDLLIMNCLRLYERELYNIILNNRNQLVIMGFNKQDSSSMDIINNVLSEKKERYVDILEYLFHRSNADKNRFYRIYNAEVYDRYFALQISDLPILDKQKFLDISPSDLENIFDTWMQIGAIDKLLGFLEDLSKEIPSNIIPNYLLVLIKYADAMDSKASGNIYNNWFLSVFLFSNLFARLSLSERIDFLFHQYRKIFSLEINGLSALTYLYEPINKKHLLEEQGKMQYVQLLLGKIEQSFTQNPKGFLQSSKALYNLYRWRDMKGSNAQITEKLEDFIKSSKENVLYLLCAFTESMYQTGGDFTGTKFYIKHKTIEEFISIETVKEAISQLNLSEVDNQEERLIQLFNDNEDPLL